MKKLTVQQENNQFIGILGAENVNKLLKDTMYKSFDKEVNKISQSDNKGNNVVTYLKAVK